MDDRIDRSSIKRYKMFLGTYRFHHETRRQDTLRSFLSSGNTYTLVRIIDRRALSGFMQRSTRVTLIAELILVDLISQLLMIILLIQTTFNNRTITRASMTTKYGYKIINNKYITLFKLLCITFSAVSRGTNIAFTTLPRLVGTLDKSDDVMWISIYMCIYLRGTQHIAKFKRTMSREQS